MFDTYLVKPLFNLLTYVYGVLPLHDFGLAIIVFTIIIRAVLWPLVNKQLHSQRAIQKLQPEMTRIKKESKGDKQLEGKLVMELYKEKEISPMAPILPLLVQMPVLIALFIVIKDIVANGAIAKMAYAPVKSLDFISHIVSGASKFNPSLLGLIDLSHPSIILAAVAAGAQFIQTRQIQAKQQPSDSQAQTMAMMTYLFPVLTFVIGLSLPGALALFWIITSMVAILQQYLMLRRDVEELENGGKK